MELIWWSGCTFPLRETLTYQTVHPQTLRDSTSISDYHEKGKKLLEMLELLGKQY